jgi:hypothetical protein
VLANLLPQHRAARAASLGSSTSPGAGTSAGDSGATRSINVALSLISVLAFDNKEGQAAFLPHLGELLALSQDGIKVSHVLLALFHGNIASVTSVPAEEVRALVGVVHRERSADSLSVLRCVVAVQGQCIRKNQSLVLNSLIHGGVLELYTDDPARREALFANPEGNRDRVNFYVAQVDLLSDCGRGLNFLTEKLLQPLIPLEILAADITAGRLPLRVERALVSFLNDVFLDTEAPVPGLPDNPLIAQVVARMLADLEALLRELESEGPSAMAQKRVKGDLWALAFDSGVLAMLKTYFRWIYLASSTDAAVDVEGTPWTLARLASTVSHAVMRLGPLARKSGATKLELAEIEAVLVYSGACGVKALPSAAGAPLGRATIASKRLRRNTVTSMGPNSERAAEAREAVEAEILASSAAEDQQQQSQDRAPGVGRGSMLLDSEAAKAQQQQNQQARTDAEARFQRDMPPPATDVQGSWTYLIKTLAESSVFIVEAEFSTFAKILVSQASWCSIITRLVANASSTTSDDSTPVLLRICQRIAFDKVRFFFP